MKYSQYSTKTGWHGAAAHGMVALLALEYLVVVILSFFGHGAGNFVSSKSTIDAILSPAHVVIGCIVMAAAIYFLVFELMRGNRGTKKWGVYGFVAVLVMFIAGILGTFYFSSFPQDIVSFVSALAFLAAFASYDRLVGVSPEAEGLDFVEGQNKGNENR